MTSAVLPIPDPPWTCATTACPSRAAAAAATSAAISRSRPTNTPRGRLGAAGAIDRPPGHSRRTRAATSAPSGRRSGARSISARTRSSSAGGTPSTSVLGAGPSCCVLIACTSANAPVNGRTPVSASNNITPTLYQSLAAVSGCVSACSGDMYAGVPDTRRPTSTPARGGAGDAAGTSSDVSPKSSTFSTPSSRTSTFDGLMSQCRRPAACR